MASIEGVAQVVECQTPDLTPEEFAKKRDDFLLFQAEKATRQQRTNTVTDVPVYFHIMRLGNGSIPSNGWPATQAKIDESIAALNTAYGRAGLRFYQLGRINELDYDNFNTSPFDWQYSKYSYVSTALNIYLNARANFAPRPEQNPANTGIANVNNIATEVITFTHETGHTFGLLHTYGAFDSYKYPVIYDHNNPTNTAAMQVDHPYNFGPGGRPRELAIRTPNGSKEFQDPNCAQAGDLCCDTEADCIASPYLFPAVIPNANGQVQLNCATQNCSNGCGSCGAPGLYKDYNLDPIAGNPSNPMASTCGLITTDCQIDQIKSTYDRYLTGKYQAVDINVNSKVTKRDGPGLSKVHIEWSFYGPMSITGLKCASFTNKSGDFQAILDGIGVSAKVRRLGSGYTNSSSSMSGPQYIDTLTYSDWSEGVDVCDLFNLRKHVYGVRKLNGWQKLAGDIDRNQTLNGYDPTTLNGFILGYFKTFPAYDAPWKFVPKFIPERNLDSFNRNPFIVNSVPALSYTSSSFIYATSAARSGYGGYHIGDLVDGPCSTLCTSDIDAFDVENEILGADKNYRLDLKVQDFRDVAIFQMGIKYDKELLEITDITSDSIAGFNKNEHTNLPIMENNHLKISWFYPAEGTKTLSDNSNLISIYVRTKQPVVNLQSAISIDKDSFPTSIYTEDFGCGADPEISIDIAEISPVGERSNSDVAKMSPLVCYPNPLSGDLNIAFESAVTETGDIRIVDVNGRLVHRREINIQKGINSFVIPETDMRCRPGLLTVTLRGAVTNKSTRLIKR